MNRRDFSIGEIVYLDGQGQCDRRHQMEGVVLKGFSKSGDEAVVQSLTNGASQIVELSRLQSQSPREYLVSGATATPIICK